MRLRPLITFLALLCALACAPAAAATPIDGRGMWIWYVSRSDGGSPGAIVARAQAAGVKTVYIKSGDGANYWSQFSPSLVRDIRSGGINVCAWQYVYGADPAAEAAVAAQAVANGAQCLVIDAEAEYEGRYASAQVYMRTLRADVGYAFPIGLASFPYVDYHPAFPYSVFLGPGGAQYDMPQMYWSQIGSPVETVYQHTYESNRIYGRAIAPLGETDNGVSAADVMLFRGLDVLYGAPGISWWDYAWTAADGLWSAISGYYTVISSVQTLGYPRLGYGSTGDQVVRLQELLAGAIPSQRITGKFASETQGNLEAFQRAHGLLATGRTNSATWHALGRMRPLIPSWSIGTSADGGAAIGGAAARRAGSAARRPSNRAPQSATERAVRYEIVGEPRRAEAHRSAT